MEISRETTRPETAVCAQGLPPAEVGKREENAQPLSVGDYILMFILFGIPFVNLIIMLVWGFGGNININKRNCARAYLVIMLIALSLSLILGIFGFLMAGRFGPMLRDLVEAHGGF